MIRHLRNASGLPFATLASAQVGKHIHFAASVCGPRDQFSRKIGRHISTGRLHKEFASTVTTFEDLMKDPGNCKLVLPIELVPEIFTAFKNSL
jgi:hypothetical protein